MQCEHDMQSGIALAPVYGRLDGFSAKRGDTLCPVDGEVIKVQKCRKCGYSVSFKQNHTQKTDVYFRRNGSISVEPGKEIFNSGE